MTIPILPILAVLSGFLLVACCVLLLFAARYQRAWADKSAQYNLVLQQALTCEGEKAVAIAHFQFVSETLQQFLQKPVQVIIQPGHLDYIADKIIHYLSTGKAEKAPN